MLRFIRPIGMREEIRVYWATEADKCPNCVGSGHSGYHNADRKIRDLVGQFTGYDSAKGCYTDLIGRPSKDGEFPEDVWPTKCDWCPAIAPPDANRQFNRNILYDNPEGEPVANDIFWRETPGSHYCEWDDCDGRHLVIVCPDGTSRGMQWDTSMRATNCAKPQDRRHRCWWIEGTPPNISSVDNQRRCGTGNCSINMGGRFHKTLRNGEWV